MSRRIALLIGNTEYEDGGLPKLNSPEMDLRELAGLLQDPQVGAFDEVTPLFNRPFADVYPAIAEFFADKQREDTLLLYFSGHGVLDDQGRLYLALKNTRLNRLSGSALPSHFLKDEMDRSRSKRQILLLDCCHSGAFGKGAKGAVGAQAITEDTFAGQGHERVVLTATDKTEMAWEGDQIVDKEMEMSLFTHFVVEGLKTGAADADADGAVTPNELYNYVFDQVVAATHKQKPHCFVYDRGGELHLAHNPHPRPARLSPQLQEALASPYVAMRDEALKELVRLLNGQDRGRSTAAQAALQHIAEHDDSRRLASAAAQALAAFTGQTAAPAPATAPRPGEVHDPLSTNPRLPVDRQRFAADEASRDAYLKQRAEAARAAKAESAEPRLPVDRQRFAADEASRDAYLKQRAEAARAAKPVSAGPMPAPPMPSSAPAAAAPRATGLRSLLKPIALTSLGWAIAMAVMVAALSSLSVAIFLGEWNGSVFIAPLFAGLVGGIFTGAALRVNRKSVPWWVVGFIALVWMVSQLLFMAAVLIDPSAPAWGIAAVIVLWVIAGGITALAGLLTLGPDRPSFLKSLQALLISAAAWALALPAGVLAVLPIVLLAGESPILIALGVGLIIGAVAGAVGGGVMFWQLNSAARKIA